MAMDSRPLLAVEAGPQSAAAAQPAVARRACWLIGSIIVTCAMSLSGAALCSIEYPVVLSHALLAFALGLRHAVDCDHLAAIDNVTRQLLNRGQWPVSVGFWFALGHSTVVVMLTTVLAGGYSIAWRSFNNGAAIADTLSLAAGFVSVGLLCGIGLLNARVAVELYREWTGKRNKSQAAQDEAAENEAESSLRTGLNALPFLRRVFDNVDKPIKMYGVGFLFGLSFDTATQVGLIGLAAMTGTRGGVPPLMVMIFPLCFSCGMCLVDTGNGLLMLMTYGWANIRPVQKLFYNFVITAMSAAIALVIGSLELLQIVGRQGHFSGPVWDAIQGVDMATMGYAIIAAFFSIFIITVSYSCVSHRMNTQEDSTSPLASTLP